VPSRAVARQSNGARDQADPLSIGTILQQTLSHCGQLASPLIRYADLVISVDEMDTAERLILVVNADEP
jgi:hypothetical protein